MIFLMKYSLVFFSFMKLTLMTEIIFDNDSIIIYSDLFNYDQNVFLWTTLHDYLIYLQVHAFLSRLQCRYQQFFDKIIFKNYFFLSTQFNCLLCFLMCLLNTYKRNQDSPKFLYSNYFYFTFSPFTFFFLIAYNCIAYKVN